MAAGERPISEDELQFYVDGRLDPARLADVERYLATQPDLSRRVASWRAQRDGLRAMLASGGSGPTPPELNLNRLLEARLQRRPTWWRLAAAVVLSLAVGGAGGWYVTAMSPPNRSELALSLLQQQALASHAVYTLDPRHPIEVGAAESDHLAQWLSNRLHRSVTPPDLSGLGYRLLGGRLLATEHGNAAALFAYQDSTGNRLSVLLRPMASDLRTRHVDISNGSLNGCTWIDNGMGYAVTAVAPETTLDQIADRITAQHG